MKQKFDNNITSKSIPQIIFIKQLNTKKLYENQYWNKKILKVIN